MYFCNNHELKIPYYDDILEFERVCITRYCTGSHNLKIEIGCSNPFIEREARLSKCNDDIQSIKHIMTTCRLLNDSRSLQT